MPHPFVKWAGGKSQLVDRLHDRMPADFNDYIEPFVGGGAMLLSLSDVLGGRSVVVNDVNTALITAYRTIQTDVDTLISRIAELDGNMPSEPEAVKEYYYDQRAAYNVLLAGEEYGVESSALLIWINKHAFNGLYRVNKKGLFNVPWNRNTKPCLDEKNLRAIASAIAGVDIRQGDFEDVARLAKPGDFLFLDSPYVPVKVDSFIDYTADGFTYDDHVRLSRVYREMADKGVYVMETNHNVDLIHELYDGFDIEVVDVKRMINRNASGRTGQEVIITNYEKPSLL